MRQLAATLAAVLLVAGCTTEPDVQLRARLSKDAWALATQPASVDLDTYTVDGHVVDDVIRLRLTATGQRCWTTVVELPVSWVVDGDGRGTADPVTECGPDQQPNRAKAPS